LYFCIASESRKFFKRAFYLKQINFITGGSLAAGGPGQLPPPLNPALPAKGKFQASAGRQLPSPKSNKKGQSTCNMNMSDYSYDAIKLNNGPSGRIFLIGFWFTDHLKPASWTQK